MVTRYPCISSMVLRTKPALTLSSMQRIIGAGSRMQGTPITIRRIQSWISAPIQGLVALDCIVARGEAQNQSRVARKLRLALRRPLRVVFGAYDLAISHVDDTVTVCRRPW